MYIALLVALVTLLVVLIRRQLSIWKRKGIPYKPPSFPFGNVTPPWKGRLTLAEESQNWYEEAKAKGLKLYGNFILLTPVLTIVDVDLLKRVLVKDFHHFPDHGFYLNEKDDPLSAHLLALEGDKWKNLRAKLAPAFTSSKTKMMFQSVVDCGHQMIAFLQEKAMREPVNMKEVFASFTIDVIGSCAFGIECNSFKQRDNPFYHHGRRVFESTRLEEIISVISFAYPALAKALRMKTTKPEVERFFMKLTKDTVKYREEHNVRRNDFMQLLIDMKNTSPPDDPFTIEQLAAQAFIFFLGGFETSSTTGTFCLLELALNQEVQRKAREDVMETLKKHGGKVTYEAVQEMKYLGQVIDETMRKYPPLPVMNRICVKDYGVPESDVVIQKGTRLLIPLLAVHRDANHFPQPEKFDPERFSDENRNKIAPYTFIPFGEGPRICIGMRFGSIQTRVGLAVLLSNFIFSLNPRTQVPLKLDPQSFTLAPLGGVWLDVEPNH